MAETRSFKNYQNDEIEKKLKEDEIISHMQHLSKLKSTVVLPSRQDLQFKSKNNYDVAPSAYFLNKELSTDVVIKPEIKIEMKPDVEQQLSSSQPMPEISDKYIDDKISSILVENENIKPSPTIEIDESTPKNDNAVESILENASMLNLNTNIENKALGLQLGNEVEVWVPKVFSPKEGRLKTSSSSTDIKIIISSPIASPKAVVRKEENIKKDEISPRNISVSNLKEDIKPFESNSAISFDALVKMAELAGTSTNQPIKEEPKSIIRPSFSFLNKKQETEEEKKARETRESAEREAIVAAARLKRNLEEESQAKIVAPVQSKPKTVY